MFLIKAWLSVKIGNDQKPRYSSCMVMVIELSNFKILSFLLHVCYIPQLQSIAIPAMAFSPNNFTNLSPWGFFGLEVIIIIIFLEIGWNYMSIIITVVSNITVLVSTNVFPHLPLPYQVCLLFYKKCLINLPLLWSGYLRKIMHFRGK